MKLIYKVYRYLVHIIFKKKILKSKFSDTKKFELIYKFNYWGDKSSLSGTGSSIKKTENIRRELKKILIDYKIKSILDVPCGDFVWMKNFLNIENSPKYIGGDIVQDLINILKEKNKKKNVDFLFINITNSNLPKADILVCRDCFIHFSNDNIKKSLNNFLKSGIKYILVSDSVISDNFRNYDINTGEFRKLDLTSEPFNLPKDNLYSFKDVFNDKQNCFETKMTLWHRDQIKKYE